jgi:GH15 family glucan-1,4-alpha-glucosidase
MANLGPSIEAHAAIGNGRSVALVSRDGSIDWLCWPRFESPALFAAVVDPDHGGDWRIAPTSSAQITRAYQPGTNVVETRFVTSTGTLTVTDLMPVDVDQARRHELMPEHELLRIVRCDAGVVEVATHYAPRPDFGRRRARLTDAGPFGIRLAFGSEIVTLRGERPLQVAGEMATARFMLAAGDQVAFTLTYEAQLPAVLPPLGAHAQTRVDATAAWWRAWLPALPDLGGLESAVERSLLAIKLLAFAPSGAIVAAATTSLPERLGGELNWDYRFCWLRDAAFTTRALLAVGRRDDADAFASWLLHATRLTRPELGVLYDVYGNAPADEVLLGHLAGHRGSRPVRIRNAAARQLQLDIYGEVIDAAVQSLAADRGVDRETGHMLAGFGHFVCRNWRNPDQGIWEERGEPRHYTHSKVLCWVALDRLLTLHARDPLPRLQVDELRDQRTAIRADVEGRGFDAGLDSYVSAYGSVDVDASLLQLAWYGFEPTDAARMRGTWRRISERLGAGPGLFYRFEDSPRRGEGAFGICSFWVAEFLARGGGTLHEARTVFDAMWRHANDVGLFGEEIDPLSGAALGNFPQAYTHVGLINAALSIAERTRREEAAT